MITPILASPIAEPPIALEISLPDPLFRRLQALLDANPKESLDSVFCRAIALYLLLAMMTTDR